MRFVRYVAVQVATYGMDMGLFLLLFAFAGTGPLVANVTAKIAAGAFAYLTHRRFTFEVAAGQGHVRPALLYVALWSFNVPLSTALLGLLLWLNLPAVAAKVAADVICVGLNYWISKNYIFIGDAEQDVVGDAGQEVVEDAVQRVVGDVGQRGTPLGRLPSGREKPS